MSGHTGRILAVAIILFFVFSASSGSITLDHQIDQMGPQDTSDLNPGDVLCDVDSNVGGREGTDCHVSAGELPSSAGLFTENRGQYSDPTIRYVFTTSEYAIGFRNDGYLLDLKRGDGSGTVIEVSFEGAYQVEPTASDRVKHRNSYFQGCDPEVWRTQVENYRTLTYPGLWSGIDLVYSVTAEGLKYDLSVSPGADPDPIGFRYAGMDRLDIDDDGNLMVAAGDLVHREKAPYSYQIIGAVQHMADIDSAYRIEEHLVSFELGTYDTSLPLVIDPLILSTFLGGTEADAGTSIEVGSDGSIYVAGYTESTDFPNTTGAYDRDHNGNRDVFVLKLNPEGTDLIYSTFIGGEENEGKTGSDHPIDLAVDELGNVHVVGATASTDFPVTSGSFRGNHQGGMYDLFVLKLNADGSDLEYATYVGGDWNDGGNGVAITLDQNGNVVVASGTESTTFPTTDNAYDRDYNGGNGDAVVFRLNGDGTDLLYSTYIGSDGEDWAIDIDLDDQNNYLFVGTTGSTNYPTQAGSYDEVHNGEDDVFITKLNAEGTALIYSTFLGGSGDDRGADLVLNGDGTAIVTGRTISANFPTVEGSYGTDRSGKVDAFYSIISMDGTDLDASGFIGGDEKDHGTAISLDPEGNILMAGTTWSDDLPTTPDCYDDEYEGDEPKGFVAKLSPGADELLYLSYLGGENGDDVFDLFADEENNVFITGSTTSPDFPTFPGSYDESHNGGSDAFLFKLNLLTANITSISPNVALSSDQVELTGNGKNGGEIEEYRWFSSIDGELYLGPDMTTTVSDLSVGLHLITLWVKDDLGYWSDDVSKELIIHERPAANIVSILPDPALEGESISLEGEGTDDGSIERYLWSSDLGGILYNGTEAETVADGLSNGTHSISLKVMDNYGVWSVEVSAGLVVNGIPRASIVSVLPVGPNESESVTFTGSGTDDGSIEGYSWRSDRDGNLSTESSFNMDDLTNGTHIIYFMVRDDMGILSSEVTTSIHVNGIPRARIVSIQPDHPTDGDQIEFSGTATDDGNITDHHWSSSIDGDLSNLSTFTTSSLSVGNHTIAFWAEDDLGVSSEMVVASVRVNAIPTAMIATIDPIHSNEGEAVSFSGDWIDDGTIEAYEWTSSLDGMLGTARNFTRSDLKNGTHVIELRVRDDDGIWSKGVRETIQVNGIPRAFIEHIGPSQSIEGEPIEFRGNGTDDGLISGYRWSSDIDGILGEEQIVMFGGLTAGVHTISFSVMDDTGTWSASVRGIIAIHVYEPPTIMIEPHDDEVYPGEEITIETSYIGHERFITLILSDAHGSQPHMESGPIGENGMNLFSYVIPEEMTPGDISILIFTGNASVGSSFSILEPANRAPKIIGTPRILSDETDAADGPFRSNVDLRASVEAWDEDGDTLEFSYVWLINGDLIEPDENPDHDEGLLRHTFFSKGNVVKFQVSVFDGDLSGVGISDPITIIDTPPEFTNIELTPWEPRTTETLTVTYDHSDHDGDIEAGTSFLWLVDNGLGWTISPHTDTNVPSTSTVKGQQWKCIINPDDGDTSEGDGDEEGGYEFESNIVTIANTEPRAIISSPQKEKEYVSGAEVLFDASESLDIDDDHLTYLWTVDGIPDTMVSSISFSRSLTAGYHTIQLMVSDGTTITTEQVGVRVLNGPDLFTTGSESYFSNTLSDGNGQEGVELTYTVLIWNNGDLEATATVDFYVEGTGLDPVLIDQKEVRVPVQGYDSAFVTWNPDREGNVTFIARVVGSSPSESDTGNNEAFRDLTIAPRPVTPEPEPDRRVPVVIGTTATIALFGAAIAGYEPWKYKFFTLLIPLYTKLNHENRMDNENRSKILGFIIGMEEAKRDTYAQPGVSYSTIKKKLNFSNGALAYHLSVLEREGDIRSEKVGKYRLYFPKKVPKPQTMFLERLTDLQERLVQELRKHSEVSQKRLVKSMMESQQVISYNLNRLEQKGIVTLKKRGNRSYCQLTPEYLKSGESL